MKVIKRLRSNYASVTATVALVAALGMGGAYAAGKVSSKQIATGAVKSKHIADGQVGTPDLAPDAEIASARTAGTARAVAPNSVGSAAVQDNSLTGADVAADTLEAGDLAENAVQANEIAEAAVGSSEINDLSVGAPEIAEDAVRAEEIDDDSVGASELKGVIATVGAGGTAASGQTVTSSVTCPGGRMLIAGGYAWQDDEANSIIHSAPHETLSNTTWTVRGIVEGGSSNTLFAWANCLQV